MKKKKGFTLIELIIVIAIIGILAAVLIPSWGYFMNRARTRAQNSKARAIFNAAQKAVTDLNFAERKMKADTRYTAETGTDGLWYFYYDGHSGYRCEAASGAQFVYATTTHVDTATVTHWDTKLTNAIDKIIDEDGMVYKFCVKDYKVMAVASARFNADRYIGTYPLTLDKVEELGVLSSSDIDDQRNLHVSGINLMLFDCEDPSDVTP